MIPGEDLSRCAKKPELARCFASDPKPGDVTSHLFAAVHARWAFKKKISKVINSAGLLNWDHRPSVLLADFVAALRCSGKDEGAGLLSAPQA